MFLENTGSPVQSGQSLDTTAASNEAVAQTQTQTTDTTTAQTDGTNQDPATAAPEQPKNDPEKLAKALDRARSKIDRKTAAFHEERRLRENLQRELEKLKAGVSPANKDEQEETVESYVDRRAEEKARAEIQKTLNELREQETVKQRQTEFVKRIETLKDKMPDIQEVLEANRRFELPSYIVEAIAEYEDGPLIAAYAFKEDLMEDIAEMSPAHAFRELSRIGSIVEKLGTAKPVTKAPAPMSPTKGGKSAGQPGLEDMSSKQLMDWLKSK